MTTLTTNIIDETSISHRKAVAFLKGIIVARCINYGMKHSSSSEPSAEFLAGQEFYHEQWLAPVDRITAIHILYNRIRHKRPHTESRERDDSLLVVPRSWYQKIQEVSGATFDELEVK